MLYSGNNGFMLGTAKKIKFHSNKIIPNTHTIIKQNKQILDFQTSLLKF